MTAEPNPVIGRRRFLALAGGLTLTPLVLKAGDQDFTVVNRTGFTIDSLYVTPHDAEEWGDDILGKDTLENGERIEIVFHRKEKAALWDLSVEDTDGDSYTWEKLNLIKISEVTLFYKKGVATATFK